MRKSKSKPDATMKRRTTIVEKSMVKTPEEVVLLRALEKLCDSDPEKFHHRLTLKLNDDFVIAWLGQNGLRRQELLETKICRLAATVSDTISQLRVKLAV